MIIGVEKAGTTALLDHLARSPKVVTHQQKEMSYFSSDFEFVRGWNHAVRKYFPAHGSDDGSAETLVAAKDAMLAYRKSAMERLRLQCPSVKCVLLLREPAARAYSAFHHARLKGVETCETFEAALQLEETRVREDPDYWESALYLRNSAYAPILRAAIGVFGRENILVLFQEDYLADTRAELAKVEAFVEKSLYADAEPELPMKNMAAGVRFPWLAAAAYRLMASKGALRRLLSSSLPSRLSLYLRHTLESITRVETSHPPLNPETARLIREKLADDRRELAQILGREPP